MLLSNSSTYFSFYQNFRNRDISLIKFFEILSYRSQQSRNHYRVLPSKTISSINLVWNCGFKTYSPSKNIRMSQKNRTNGDRKLLRTIKKQKSKISLNDWKSFKKENEKLKNYSQKEKLKISRKSMILLNLKKKKKWKSTALNFKRKGSKAISNIKKWNLEYDFKSQRGGKLLRIPIERNEK